MDNQVAAGLLEAIAAGDQSQDWAAILSQLEQNPHLLQQLQTVKQTKEEEKKQQEDQAAELLRQQQLQQEQLQQQQDQLRFQQEQVLKAQVQQQQAQSLIPPSLHLASSHYAAMQQLQQQGFTDAQIQVAASHAAQGLSMEDQQSMMQMAHAQLIQSLMGGAAASSTMQAIQDDDKSTQGCWFYGRGECKKGNECKFSHEPGAVAAALAKEYTQEPLCWYFERGLCLRGTNCQFRHS